MNNEDYIKICFEIKNKHFLTNFDVFNLIQENNSYVSLKTIERFFRNDCNVHPSGKTIQTIYTTLYKYDASSEVISKDELIAELRKENEFLKKELSIKNRQFETIIKILANEKG